MYRIELDPAALQQIALYKEDRLPRTAAILVNKIGKRWSVYTLTKDISAFDRSAPDVKKIRDAFSHFDDYLQGGGRLHQTHTSGGLEVTSRWSPLSDKQGHILQYVIVVAVTPDLPALEIEIIGATNAAQDLEAAISANCATAQIAIQQTAEGE